MTTILILAVVYLWLANWLRKRRIRELELLNAALQERVDEPAGRYAPTLTHTYTLN